MPLITKPKRDNLTKEEIFELLQRARFVKEKALISFLWLTGARISEALELRRMDFIIKENGILHVNVNTKKLRDAKNINQKRPLWIKIREDDIFSCLFDHLKTIEKPEALVWDFTRYSAAKWFDRLGIWPHLFRHTRATLFANRGATEAQMVAWFGWSDSRAAYRYVKRSEKLIEPLSNLVD